MGYTILNLKIHKFIVIFKEKQERGGGWKKNVGYGRLPSNKGRKNEN